MREMFFANPLFMILWSILFFGIIGLFIYFFAGLVRREAQNNKKPIETVAATAVGKRINVTGDHSFTTYYVTFEMADSERVELQVEGELYGMIAEGDYGEVTYQGYKGLDFRRIQ